MKIAILGTRGIPNHYGGFEQYAELLSTYLVEHTDWEVTVYNSHNHPYQSDTFNGVNIVHRYDPEYKLGTVGQFIYDYNCIRHINSVGYDIIYQLGYTSSSIFNFLLKNDALLVTNMDGLEWKRSKYKKPVQKFLKYAERLAIKHSDVLIADSIGIQQYLKAEYNVESYFSAYTATIPNNFEMDILKQYQLIEKGYDLVIARMEPENNVETIIKGHLSDGIPLVLVGGLNTPFAQHLVKTYGSNNSIQFIGAIYNKKTIDALRYYSRFYFHGHSVGGTNPSLLEAMACSCNIIAHDNIFNRSILESDATYFKDENEILQILNQEIPKPVNSKIQNNIYKIQHKYSEEFIFHNLIGVLKKYL
jgi:glycosyltransferase involved in cell wall biosynthesis